MNGGLIRSPFIEGILFLLSFGIGLMGMVYGFASGRYRTDGDVIEGLTQPMKLLSSLSLLLRSLRVSSILIWINV